MGVAQPAGAFAHGSRAEALRAATPRTVTRRVDQVRACGQIESASGDPGYPAPMTYEAGDRVFVDESKAWNYILVATAVSPTAHADVDRSLRGLVLPGQRRLHFSKESDSRRREVLSSIVTLPIRAQIYVAPPGPRARDVLLGALVTDLVASNAARLVIERDESLMQVDRGVVRSTLAGTGDVGSLAWTHALPSAEPCLWISDAVAWSYAKGGDWRRRVVPLVGGRVTHL